MSVDTGCHYVIRLEGRLDESWSDWFDGMRIAHIGSPPGMTVLSGAVVDQAALHGLLIKIRNLGLTLVALNRSEV
jgi:hypothetical protein